MERSAIDARPRRRPTSTNRLFAVYVLASLVPIVVLGLGVHTAIRDEIDDRALAEAVTRAETIADVSIEPALGDADLSTGLSDQQRAALFVATASLRSDEAVLRLRVRTVTGTIVFDAADPGAGPKVDEDADAFAAAVGEPVRELTRVGADEVDGADRAGQRAVETYVAFHRPGTDEVVGVLETYLPYAPFEDAAGHATRRLTVALGLGLGVLWVVLAAVSWSVTRRLRVTADENDWLAHHDPVTGLANRLALSREIAERSRAGRPTWVAIVDLDRFREINETIGHDNAEVVLRLLGERLTAGLAPDGTVARLAGDRFGVLWPDRGPADESRLLDAIDLATSRPVSVAGLRLTVDLTVGVAHSTQVPGGAEEVLRSADLTAHAARDAGLPLLGYSPGLEGFDPDRLALAGELGAAIDHGELELHYQPKVDLVTGAVRSVEALVRWRHPVRGLLSPVAFVPAAESTSLIHPLTAWVVTEAARQLGRWRHLSTPLAVSVNISARNLADPALLGDVLQILTDADVAPERLQVEITETAAIADPERAVAVLTQLRDAGLGISLDDFGQGATSLVSLSSLPLDELKVDRAFVLGLEDSAAQRAVVEFVITLGHRLGHTVVAEGIETEAAADLLAAMGCDEGQGYLYARPMPAAELEDWLVEHEASHEVASRR